MSDETKAAATGEPQQMTDDERTAWEMRKIVNGIGPSDEYPPWDEWSDDD